MKNMIKFLLVSTLAVFSFGQPGSLTDSIYWTSKAPDVRAVHLLAPTDREAAASSLNTRGFIIDRAIDIWGWDPALVMGYRAQLGFKWLPNAYQPNFEGTQSQGPPWPNSIKVSTDARDYTPFLISVTGTGAVTTVAKAVGQYVGNGIYEALHVQEKGTFLFTDGQVVVQDNVKYVFHKLNGMFGPGVWFTKAQ